MWRHGDWITITDRGSCLITGRSDATLNRGGVRVGTAEIYRVTESIEGVLDSLVVHLESPDADDPGTLVLFVVLVDGRRRSTTRSEPESDRDSVPACRHATFPTSCIRWLAIPTTLSGKKLELPVKKILRGGDPEQVASRGALKDPAALDAIVGIARLSARQVHDVAAVYECRPVGRRTD